MTFKGWLLERKNSSCQWIRMSLGESAFDSTQFYGLAETNLECRNQNHCQIWQLQKKDLRMKTFC